MNLVADYLATELAAKAGAKTASYFQQPQPAQPVVQPNPQALAYPPRPSQPPPYQPPPAPPAAPLVVAGPNEYASIGTGLLMAIGAGIGLKAKLGLAAAFPAVGIGILAGLGLWKTLDAITNANTQQR